MRTAIADLLIAADRLQEAADDLCAALEEDALDLDRHTDEELVRLAGMMGVVLAKTTDLLAYRRDASLHPVSSLLLKAALRA